MMSLETEHRGYKIIYSENEEVWRCWSLSLDHISLAKLKAAINRQLLKASKASVKAPALYLENCSPDLTEVAVTSLADADPEAQWDGHTRIAPKLHERVWIVGKDRYGGRGESKRQKVRTTMVALDTPEVRAWGEVLAELSAIKVEAEKAVKAHRDTFPHLTSQQLIEAGVITGKIEGRDGDE